MSKGHLRCILLFLLFATGCDESRSRNKADWEVTLRETGKEPYGYYLAYQSLKYYFPEAYIQRLSTSFRYNNMDNKMKYNYLGSTLMILVGLDFKISESEWKELKRFISNGNEVILFCSSLDGQIERELGCYKEINEEETYGSYLQTVALYKDTDALSLVSIPRRTFGFDGRSIRGYFSFRDVDTATADNKTGDNTTPTDAEWSKPDTLGYSLDRPNFLRYKHGEGHLTLHAAPLSLSNYFLLQKGNEEYMTGIWQTLPEHIATIYWNGYFKRRAEDSNLNTLWDYPATKYAMWLGIIAILIYVLFEGKRKQRIIPIVPPLKNDSVSFVETVGRLYYNKRDHANLAEKMSQQFLDWVRTHYFLNTNVINEDFIHQLTIKSGQPEARVRALIDMVFEVKHGGVTIDEAYLYQFYNIIQQFYKNNHT